MRRKVLQDVANALCHMSAGLRSDDLEVLSDLPDGALTIELLLGTAEHDVKGALSLQIAGEMAAWLKHRLESLNIPMAALVASTVRAEFRTDRVLTDRKRIVSFDWKCESSVTTDEKTYVGRLVEKHQWHTRKAWQPVSGEGEIRCRVAACPEPLGDGKEWSFYLLNDGRVPLDLVVLKAFGHEWGDFGHTEHPDVTVTDLAPGASAVIWRDNDDELRMWLTLLVRVRGREVELLLEFPMLYRRKGDLPLVPGLAKPGWAVSAVVPR